MNDFKRMDITEGIWIYDLGNNSFDLYIRASSPLGAHVYSFEKGRIKCYQRRSYAGASKTKYYNFYDQWTGIIFLIAFAIISEKFGGTALPNILYLLPLLPEKI